MDAANPGGLGGTYAGNPLAVAAAHAVLDVIEQEQLLARSVTLGARLEEFLGGLRERIPAIAEVRGLGSMVAMECVDPATQAPDSALVARIQKQALQRGLLLLSCGQYGNVVRFLYPLTIPDAQFDAALETLADAMFAAVDAAVAA